MSVENLSQRRDAIETQWSRFTSGSPFLKKDRVREDIMSSWQRSAESVPRQPNYAPVDDEYSISRRWEGSSLRQAVQGEQDNMMQLAKEGELVAAIADPAGKLLWTCASKHMRSRAESVNFMAGGCWDERSVGTNAVGLSLKLCRPVTVFSSEHYLPTVHDWVCYASPIIHPRTGECVGVLDMSTTWKRHTPLGQTAVSGLAQSIAAGLPEIQPRANLEIHALGQPRIAYKGKTMSLPQRQIEILCLLALNPEGMSLAQLHSALYGDASVSSSTLKAELSHMRRTLDGQIGARPYRLQMSVWADFIQIWQALRSKQKTEALGLYRGSLLSQSCSPELEDWSRCIDAVMAQSLEDCEDVDMLMKKLCGEMVGGDVVRNRLSDLFLVQN